MLSQNIPLVPQWNLISGCVTTPDDGFLYIGNKTINYIANVNENEESPTEIKVFHSRQHIKSLDCDLDWSQTKYFAVLAEDNSVQIWDFITGVNKSGHRAHIKPIHGDGDEPPLECVQMCFLKNRNVISIDSSSLVRLCTTSNTFSKTKRIIPKNSEISIIKGSPYDENVFAAGTVRGLILIINLKTEHIIHTLRAHYTEITSLNWMSVPIIKKTVSKETEELEKKPTNTEKRVKLKAKTQKKNIPKPPSDDIFDIYDYDYLENEFGVPVKSKLSSSGDEVCFEKPKDVCNANFNFVEACQNVKDQINALDKFVDDDDLEDEKCSENYISQQVTLQDCQNAEKVRGDSSISCASNNSLELINNSTDESEAECNRDVLHKVDVHRNPEYSQNIDTTEVEENNVNDQEQQSILLASSSREPFVWIWNTDTGSSIEQLQLKGTGHAQNFLIQVLWINQWTLLSNNQQGDLLQWSMSLDKKNSKYCFQMEKRPFAQRGVVSICKLKNLETVWTISSYRELVCFNIKENKVLATFSCASTNISAIRERTDDMNKLAFACADRRIGILNISKVSSKFISIKNYSNKIDSSVLAIAWSTDSKLIAFGTKEGGVGVINLEKPTSLPLILNPFSGQPIYSIDWSGNDIFVCSNGKIGIYSGFKKNRHPHVLDSITKATTISIREKYLLVGTKCGHIELYRKGTEYEFQYIFLTKLQICSKYITEINWSPIQLTRFAVASMGNNIAILYLSKDGDLETSRILKVTDHKKVGNTCIKWSNRNENLFVSSGIDGTVRVWDLRQPIGKELISMKQFMCPMSCCLFSPIDENIIICAGKSTSIEFFDITSTKLTEKNTLSSSSLKKVSVNVQWATKVVTPNDFGKSTDRNKNIKNKSASMFAINSDQKEVTQLLEKLEIKNSNDHPSKLTDFLKTNTTILHLTSKDINKDSLRNLKLIIDSDNNTTDDLLIKKLFGTKKNVEELLNIELQNHQTSNTNSIANIIIPQMTGDIKSEIIKCTRNKDLTAWHVAVAPTVSYEFWKISCMAYANQLLEQGLTLQASIYFLAIHDINEIINNLLEKNYYKESWIYAKLYLQHDDPTLDKILEKWIAYLHLNGHLEGAAIICALSGQLKKCYEILKQRVRPTESHMEVLQIMENKLGLITKE